MRDCEDAVAPLRPLDIQLLVHVVELPIPSWVVVEPEGVGGREGVVGVIAEVCQLGPLCQQGSNSGLGEKIINKNKPFTCVCFILIKKILFKIALSTELKSNSK